MTPPIPFPDSVRQQWALNPAVAFLNHGSFGAVPLPVMAEYDQWRHRIEADPVEIIARRRRGLVDEVKAVVGRELGMSIENFGLVTNATEAVNAVLRSLDLRPGDELLTTNHVYHAVRQSMRFAAKHSGATVREIEIPLPVVSPADLAARVIEGFSDKTRLLVIDHVTSPTALIFPLEKIIPAANERGIEVLVDGAHAPGMFPLDVEPLGAAFYAGNLHKWCCCPRGCGFLHVRPGRKSTIHPNIISHDYGSTLANEFEWQGTRDLAAWLSIPAAFAFLNSIGQPAIQRHNTALRAWAHQMLLKRLGAVNLYGEPSLLGTMATIAVPATLHSQPIDPLQQRLYSEFNVEAPLLDFAGQRFTRISCQIFNTPRDYERLADALVSLSPS